MQTVFVFIDRFAHKKLAIDFICAATLTLQEKASVSAPPRHFQPYHTGIQNTGPQQPLGLRHMALTVSMPYLCFFFVNCFLFFCLALREIFYYT